VYDAEGRVTKGGRTRDAFLSSPALRRVLSKYGEGRWLLGARASHGPVFPSQKGGPMTPASMARFLKGLYREAGISGATQRQAHADHATRRARDRPEGDRGDRRPQQHQDDRRLRRVQPAAARPHPAGRDVVSAADSCSRADLAHGGGYHSSGRAAANFYPVKVIHERFTDDGRSSGKQNVTTAANAPANIERPSGLRFYAAARARCAPQNGPKQGGPTAPLPLIRRPAASGN
jgi:hypothetical protein